MLRILDGLSDGGASATTEPRLLWQETIEMLLKARVMLLDRTSTHSLWMHGLLSQREDQMREERHRRERKGMGQ